MVAPVVHAVAQHGGPDAVDARAEGWITHHAARAQGGHDESRPHSHGHAGQQAPHAHGEGSVEHLRAWLAPSRGRPVVRAPLWLLAWSVPGGEARAGAGQPERLPTMPQGP